MSSSAPWSFPPPWWRAWRRTDLPDDVIAGLVVAVMLIPQSLAYAMLAGLPPQVGLLASLLPLPAYAVFGSSRALSVGPAAVSSLMIAQALGPLAVPHTASYLWLAGALALGSGVLMLALGVLRLGFLSQLLSLPVVQGFTVASALLILLGQLSPLLGLPGLGHALPEMWQRVLAWRELAHPGSAGDAVVGLGTIALLWVGPALARRLAPARWQRARGWGAAVRLWPLLVLAGAAGSAMWLNASLGWSVHVVGNMPWSPEGGWGAAWLSASEAASSWHVLIVPCLLISLVGFVSSVSVAQSFASRQGERIDADRELLGLGLANVGSAVVGSMSVAGGLSRSAVNEAAGARSPLSGLITAAILLVIVLVAMPLVARLPVAALAAVIIVAASNLVQLDELKQAWRYDRADAAAFVCTALGVLLIGFESGILMGLACSLGAMVWRRSQPHVVEVGRVPGSPVFRNPARYEVERLPRVMFVRVDESLDFTNVQRVEQRLLDLLDGCGRPIDRLVLVMTAVNHIDHTAVQHLSMVDQALRERGITLHAADIKGPVLDRLQGTDWFDAMAGRVHFSAIQAWEAAASGQGDSDQPGNSTLDDGRAGS